MDGRTELLKQYRIEPAYADAQ